MPWHDEHLRVLFLSASVSSGAGVARAIAGRARFPIHLAAVNSFTTLLACRVPASLIDSSNRKGVIAATGAYTLRSGLTFLHVGQVRSPTAILI